MRVKREGIACKLPLPLSGSLSATCHVYIYICMYTCTYVIHTLNVSIMCHVYMYRCTYVIHTRVCRCSYCSMCVHDVSCIYVHM